MLPRDFESEYRYTSALLEEQEWRIKHPNRISLQQRLSEKVESLKPTAHETITVPPSLMITSHQHKSRSKRFLRIHTNNRVQQNTVLASGSSIWIPTRKTIWMKNARSTTPARNYPTSVQVLSDLEWSQVLKKRSQKEQSYDALLSQLIYEAMTAENTFDLHTLLDVCAECSIERITNLTCPHYWKTSESLDEIDLT